MTGTNYDIVGDVHGCLLELSKLLEKLGYSWDHERNIYQPPNGRLLVFVGDIVDRGRSSYETFLYVKTMVEAGYALMVRGNHDDKFMRWAKGNNVMLLHGLDKTVQSAKNFGTPKEEIYEFLKDLPYYLLLDDEKLAVVHAAWKPSMATRHNMHKKCRTWALFGPVTGKKLDSGLPDRIDWAAQREERSPIVVYGHQPHKELYVVNNAYCIDTGCVFGGHLTALRYPEMEFVQVRASAVYDVNQGW